MTTATNETPANVAAEATKPADLSPGRLLLIGTAGAVDDMNALVRMSGGRIVKVSKGDRLDGGEVQAIVPGRLALLRRGRLETLIVPGG